MQPTPSTPPRPKCTSCARIPAALGVFVLGALVTGGLLWLWLPGEGMILSSLACLAVGFTFAAVLDTLLRRRPSPRSEA